MATIEGSSVEEALRLALAAESIGVSHIVLQPPLGQKLSGTDLSAFYSALMGQLNVPVGIQNAPEFLGIGRAVDEILALRRRHPTSRS